MIDTADVELDITQVKDGWEYKGRMTIDDVAFDYNIKFGVHIEQLYTLPGEKFSREYGKELFQISVNDSKGKPVALDDKIWGLFLATTVKFAIDFYNNPQTRDSQEGLMGMIVRGEGPLGELGVSGNIGMSAQFKLKSNPVLEDFLKPYKEESK